MLGEERLTAALLDRLTYKAHTLEFVGESYRFRQRLQQAEQQSTSTVSPLAERAPDAPAPTTE